MGGGTLIGVLAFFAANSSQSGQLVNDTNFFQNTYAYIEKCEYDIRWISEQSVYKSANRANNIRFTYFDDGFAAEPRDINESDWKPWKFSISLESYGKSPSTVRRMTKPNWIVNRNSASLMASGITIEYRNEKQGMRQNFLVMAPPIGTGPLRLVLTVNSSGLDWHVNEAEDVVFFTQDAESSKEIARYCDLNVFDSAGSRLEAGMVRLSDTQFAITANDETAVYPVLIDPLTLITNWAGTQSGMMFGHSVSTVGRIQGPLTSAGVMVGAPNFDNGNYANVGKVFVYHDQNGSLPSEPTWAKEGDQANEYFGWSVADAGNVNNDGYDDIIIGAPGYNSNKGRALIFAGSFGGLGSNPVWEKQGDQTSARFGYSVASADVQGDDDLIEGEYSDVIIGARDYDYNGNIDCGAAFVFHGSANWPSLTPDWSYFGQSQQDYFGWSVANAHVVDLVGGYFNSIIIGAPYAHTAGQFRGAAYIFRGSPSGLGNQPTTTLLGTPRPDKPYGTRFGFSVAGAEDVNGDGYGDVLVGAPWDDNGEPNEGMAFLYHGSYNGVDTSRDWIAESNQAHSWFGYSVAGYNISGDDKSDIAIGAPYYDFGFVQDCGAVYFYLGHSYLPVLDQRVMSFVPYSHTGWSLAMGYVEYYRGRGLVIGEPDRDGHGVVSAWKYVY